MVELKNFRSIIILIFLIMSFEQLAFSLVVKFTNFKCQAYDKPFADIPKCYLKALARDKVSLNLHVRLHQVPVNNVSFTGTFFHKVSSQSYRPFLYNNSVDFCKFLKNPHRFLFWKIVYDIIKPASNINHTCPYNHDIIVKNLILRSNNLQMTPFPSGEYLVVLRVMAYNNLKAEIRCYFSLQE